MFKGQLPMCPGKQLRWPQAPDVRGNRSVEHEGVVVVRTGEDKGDTARLRTMYLYSPTIRYRSGKLVCSQDWRDYKLNDWIRFTVDDQERFFSNTEIARKYNSRLCPHDMATVQVQVRYFLCPDFITNTRCNGYAKVWSPEVGPAFIRTKYIGKEENHLLQPNVLYQGWLSWGVNQVNFCPHDVDEQDWPYEREALWEVSTDTKDMLARITLPTEEYQKELEIFHYAAEKETNEEKERRDLEQRALSGRNVVEEDASRAMIVPLQPRMIGDGYKSMNSSNHSSSLMSDNSQLRRVKHFGEQPAVRPFYAQRDDDHPMIRETSSIGFGRSSDPAAHSFDQAPMEDDFVMVRGTSSINFGGSGGPDTLSRNTRNNFGSTVKLNSSPSPCEISEKPENASSRPAHTNGSSVFTTRFNSPPLKTNNTHGYCYDEAEQDFPVKPNFVVSNVVSAGRENFTPSSNLYEVIQPEVNAEQLKSKKGFFGFFRKA